MFKHKRTLQLEEPQQRELEQARDRDPRAYVRERAVALLRVAQGQSPHHVARQGVLKPRHPDTVYAWLDRYQEKGLEGLVQLPRVSKRGFSPSGSGAPPRDAAPSPASPRAVPA